MIDAQIEVNKLCRQLGTLEVIIKEMLSIRLPTSILKEKMAQAEATVMQLPDDNEFLVHQWRNKVAGWYKEYSQLLVPEVVVPMVNGDAAATAATNNSPIQPAAGKQAISKSTVSKVASHYSMPSTSRAPPPSPPPSLAQIETEKPAADDDFMAKPAESFNWGQTPSNGGPIRVLPKTRSYSTEPLLRLPPHDLYGVEDHDQANGGDVFNQYEENLDFVDEEDLKEALLRAITQQPPVDVFDFPNLKQLAKLVADIDDLLNAYYWKDPYLQMTLLEALQAKLPPAKWEQYLVYLGTADNSIRNLKRFIVCQLRIVYDLIKDASEVKVASDYDEENDGTTGDNFCNFCKNTGHYMTDCPRIRYTMCYICFDNSHGKKSCRTKRMRTITITKRQTNGGR